MGFTDGNLQNGRQGSRQELKDLLFIKLFENGIFPTDFDNYALKRVTDFHTDCSQ